VTYCEASELQNLLYERLQDIITLDEATYQDFLTRLYCHPAVLYQRLQQFFELDPVCFFQPFIGYFNNLESNRHSAHFGHISAQLRPYQLLCQ
jgi:hypothetical protein